MRVWIEIKEQNYQGQRQTGFTLLWGCGLKFYLIIKSVNLLSFTLLWGCGLKFLNLCRIILMILFHPLMRVWIEIKSLSNISNLLKVSPSYEGVDWNINNSVAYDTVNSFTLLWGCGLKFNVISGQLNGVVFHPLMRVWIEIRCG